MTQWFVKVLFKITLKHPNINNQNYTKSFIAKQTTQQIPIQQPLDLLRFTKITQKNENLETNDSYKNNDVKQERSFLKAIENKNGRIQVEFHRLSPYKFNKTFNNT